MRTLVCVNNEEKMKRLMNESEKERMEDVVLLNVTAGNVADCCVCDVFLCVVKL